MVYNWCLLDVGGQTNCGQKIMGLLKLFIELLDRAFTYIIGILLADVTWQFLAELVLHDFNVTETLTTFKPNLANLKIGIKLVRSAYWYFT